MIINNNLQAVRSIYAKAAMNSTRSTKLADSKLQEDDELVLSPEAKSFSATLQAIQNQSGDVRMDKVKYYEEKLASGEYKVDANALAAKILASRY